MNIKGKTAILIATFLLLTIATTLVTVSPSNAQTSGQMASFAYLIVEPNPVGVGQTTYIAMRMTYHYPAQQKPTTSEDTTTN